MAVPSLHLQGNTSTGLSSTETSGEEKEFVWALLGCKGRGLRVQMLAQGWQKAAASAQRALAAPAAGPAA